MRPKGFSESREFSIARARFERGNFIVTFPAQQKNSGKFLYITHQPETRTVSEIDIRNDRQSFLHRDQTTFPTLRFRMDDSGPYADDLGFVYMPLQGEFATPTLLRKSLDFLKQHHDDIMRAQQKALRQASAKADSHRHSRGR